MVALTASTPLRVLGVDPGLMGGWAVVDAKGNLFSAGSFPTHIVKKNGKKSLQIDGPNLAAILDLTSSTHAFVENVSSRPRQQGQFQFGVNTGIIHGILHALNVSLHKVSPASWKAVYGIKRADDQSKAETKTHARKIAASLYPQHAKLFSRVKDDGVAEATLIALYGLNMITTPTAGGRDGN